MQTLWHSTVQHSAASLIGAYCFAQVANTSQQQLWRLSTRRVQTLHSLSLMVRLMEANLNMDAVRRPDTHVTTESHIEKIVDSRVEAADTMYLCPCSAFQR